MVRFAAVLANDARTAGRATLVPIEAKAREATMRAEAIVMGETVWLVMERRGGVGWRTGKRAGGRRDRSLK